MTQLSFSFSITCYKCSCKGYQERPKGSISKEDCTPFKSNYDDVSDDDDDFIFSEREKKPQYLVKTSRRRSRVENQKLIQLVESSLESNTALVED